MENLRKTGPVIKAIENVSFPPFEKIKLDNGIDLYVVSQGTQDIIKVELVFESGRLHEHKKVVSRITNNQIKEGSKNMDSKTISDTIDYYGGTLKTGENLDSCSLSLFTLGRYFEALFPIFHEIVTTPQFPEEELRKYKHIHSERLKIELEKNDVIAYRTITEKVFGKEHPYGYNSEISDYNAIEREDLVQHYHKNYGANNCNIFVSGLVEDKHIRMINQYFGNNFRLSEPKIILPQVINEAPGTMHISSSKEHQTAIKIGRRLFNRKHKDYPGMYFLNAVLGGFFGSRLMSNIREDKGFTYNIYSELDVLKHDGMFLIATEVGDEYIEDTINEISNELADLREELIDDEEMSMVKNYLLGRILNFIDGPFNTSRILKSMISADLGTGYLDELITKIKHIDAFELRDLANQYLRDEDMWTITVGKEKES